MDKQRALPLELAVFIVSASRAGWLTPCQDDKEASISASSTPTLSFKNIMIAFEGT